MNNELMHYGTKRHSGRYPWGSGEEPYQHDSAFLANVKELKESGMSDTEIARAMGMSTTEFRKRKSIEKAEQKSNELAEIRRLKDKSWSNVAIAERIGRNESYVRSVIDPIAEERSKKLQITADILKESVDANDFIDIGPGTEIMLDSSRTKFMTSVKKLQDEGYTVHYLQIEQAGIPGQYTSVQVLAKPGVTTSDVYKNRDKIQVATNGINEALISKANSGEVEVSSLGIRKPKSIDSNRIDICYAEDGGKDKDGVIEIRRGVNDLSLGNSNYAQVRIAVDGTHYLKGMAVYADDLPDGIDIRFNTNKSSDTPKMKVLKEMKTNPDGSINWDNPFGATLEMEDGKIVGQSTYKDENGKDQLSAINIVRSEGSWNTWSATLASQFLSKQPMGLINQQLNKSYSDKKEEFDSISKLTNPEVKKLMLDQFANDCDASASHLKAAALPRQSSKVILPLTDISDNEIYAPGYRNGEEVVLIRYPHGGTFEIPTLTVNNNIESGKRVIGTQAIDAVGISSKVAERLSGADFDGDTVVVIPTASAGQKIKTSNRLKDLIDFDPKEQYGPKTYEGLDIKIMTEAQKQQEMGKVSNLITDMTLRGATDSELARAVKHSMVVIDAPKHKLNYKQSEVDNDIKGLKEKYQGGANKGASTLISKANADYYIEKRVEKNGRLRTDEEQEWYDKASKNIDILNDNDKKKYKTISNKLTKEEYQDYKEGKKIYRYTGETNIKFTSKVRTKEEEKWFKSVGSNTSNLSEDELKKYNKISKKVSRKEANELGLYKEVPATTKVSTMSVKDDAYELSSGTPTENTYANYANKLKALANEARKEYRSTENSKYNPQAKIVYSKEVASLNAKLKVAKTNSPLERKAQVLADVTVKAKINDNPDMDSDELKKLRTQALAAARAKTGASKSERSINITDKEWEAIQAGAISSSRLTEILNNTNMDKVKELATPRNSKELTNAQIAKIQNLSASGYTLSEIADSLGVSVTTISKYSK